MRNIRIPLLMLIAVSLLLSGPVHGFDDATKKKINDFVAKIMSCRAIIGMNLAVVKDRTTLMTEGYGVIDLDKKTPVNSKTLFGIASLTKAFTTTLLGQILADNG